MSRSGAIYEFEEHFGETLQLTVDLLVSVESSAISLADVLIEVTREVSIYADLQAVISRSIALFADLDVVITRSAVVHADLDIVVISGESGGSDTAPVSGSRAPNLEFLGKGLKFPFTFQRRSGGAQISTATSSDHAHIHESICQILGTRKGERFLRPEFGTSLHELVFEPNDSVLYGLIRHEVMTALDEWEPRVIVTDVLVGPGEDEHLVLVNISYRLISSQVEGNMVYPFFRELE